MKDFQPWDDSWQYEIIHILLPYQSSTPVDMGWDFTYPVFFEAVNQGLKGERFWKSVAGAMIFVMGHQPNHCQVPSYVYWLKNYNPSIIHDLVYDGVENALANKLEKAIWLFQAAILLNSDLPESHFNLGLAYGQLGLKYIEKKQKKEGEYCLLKAVQYFKNTLELDPNLNLACYNLKYLYFQMGIVDDGVNSPKKETLLLMQKDDEPKLPNNEGLFRKTFPENNAERYSGTGGRI